MLHGSISMRIAKIRIEAPVTSFRQPHFLIERQLTFDMPPPSTIYGHVASALGELPNVRAFRFGYHFTFESRSSDYEHQQIITMGSPKAKAKIIRDGKKFPISINAALQPHSRDFLFRPSLTLYLDDPSLYAAFRAPAYCVVLGRSQDLACVVSSEIIELEQKQSAYFESVLLPFSMRQSVAVGTTSLMPRYIAPPPERHAYFERYIILHDRVFAGKLDNIHSVAASHRLVQNGKEQNWWVDPNTPTWMGAHRAVVLHGFE